MNAAGAQEFVASAERQLAAIPDYDGRLTMAAALSADLARQAAELVFLAATHLDEQGQRQWHRFHRRAIWAWAIETLRHAGRPTDEIKLILSASMRAYDARLAELRRSACGNFGPLPSPQLRYGATAEQPIENDEQLLAAYQTMAWELATFECRRLVGMAAPRRRRCRSSPGGPRRGRGDHGRCACGNETHPSGRTRRGGDHPRFRSRRRCSSSAQRRDRVVSLMGIDPGNEGALALVSATGELLEIADMPCVADGTKGRRTVNAALLAVIVLRWSPTQAYVELIGARPTDAKVAAFAFGRCRGAIEGVLGALGVPTTMLTVPTWRRAVGLPAGATKEMARGEAIRRWPAMASHFARKMDDGRAEAALIAAAGIARGRP